MARIRTPRRWLGRRRGFSNRSILVWAVKILSIALVIVVIRGMADVMPLPPKLSLEEYAQQITVKVISGDSWGSGILMAHRNGVYTVVTNDHVLSEQNSQYQIQTYDGNIHSGLIVYSATDFEEDDLAILKFTDKEHRYRLGKLGGSAIKGETVFSSGFPNDLSGHKTDSVVFNQGSVEWILGKPLRGGYQVGYTSEVYKGMSGGPVINSQQGVVAINGMHAHPLLGRPYIYKDQTTPDESWLERMTQYSWGIPIDRVQKYLGVSDEFGGKISLCGSKKSKG